MALIFRHNGLPPLVQQTLLSIGWVEYDETIHEEEEWNLYWKGTRPTMGEYAAGKSYQKLIHFPKTGVICTKDSLARIIKRNRGWFGKVYHFTPSTYCLPNETKQFQDAFTRQAVNGHGNDKQMWICKPTDLSRGRKITIISNLQDLQYDQQSVIQEYIERPLLIRGTKWDMRIYVLITQVRPLKIYLYKEGIVRFSSERYNTDCLQNVFSHLTNSSINKYAANNTSESLKWTFSQLRSYFVNSGYDYDQMWAQIEQIIQLTCINLCSLVPDLKCCFELLGFDIMMDEQMKPWLLEVNSGPAMTLDCNIDNIVKPALLKDTIKLNNFEAYRDFKEQSRANQTSKTSNIHSNFFSKRTTATSRKEESVVSQTAASSTCFGKPPSSKKPVSVKEKYNTNMNVTNSSKSQYSKQYAVKKNIDSIDLFEYETVAGSSKRTKGISDQLVSQQHHLLHSSESHPVKESTKVSMKGSGKHQQQSGTTMVSDQPRGVGDYEDLQSRQSIDAGLNTAADEHDVVLEVYHKSGKTNSSVNALGLPAEMQSKSKNLLSQYQSTNDTKTITSSSQVGGSSGTGALSANRNNRKPTTQYSSMLPKVNTFSRTNLNKRGEEEEAASDSNGEVAQKRNLALLHSSIDPLKVGEIKQASSVQTSTKNMSMRAHLNRQQQQPDDNESANSGSGATPLYSNSRNRTTEVPRKSAHTQIKQSIRGPPTIGQRQQQSAYSIMAATANNAKKELMTEEMMEHEKQRRQARIKQQNDLNSRLSVKKTTLSKLLDAQKRKERILDPSKCNTQYSERAPGGGMFRGNQRNYASRLDDPEDEGVGFKQQRQQYAQQNRGHQGPKIPDNYQLPPKDKFKRDTTGHYELIFPFNNKSAELAFALNRQVGARASMGAPNFLKMLVQEIKQHNEEYQLFIKNGFRYASE